MLRFDKLTVKAQEALQAAQEVAATHGQQQVEPLHLLAALIDQQDGVVSPVLAKLGASAASLLTEANSAIERMPKVSGAAQQYLSQPLNDLVTRSFDEAARFKDEYVSTEHLLLALGRR